MSTCEQVYYLIYEHKERRFHVHTYIVGLRICATDVCILSKYQEQNIKKYIQHPPKYMYVYLFEMYSDLLLYWQILA